ncbi:MAG: c-type cytochrome [Gammaproteobacteria bacterium]|nr:c-type cytochrome [Gammaproteobacteria bacterium]
MIKSTFNAIFALLLAANTLPALANGDAVAGKSKAETCLGCHAQAGYFNVYPSYRVPKLGNQNEAYILDALKEYKSGERSHQTMRANASGWTAQDMADIAAFLTQAGRGKSSFIGTAGNVADGEKKSATCVSCHGPAGAKPILPQYPILAGQYADYLYQVLQAYKIKDHYASRNHQIMNSQVVNLSDQDMHDLAAYFASQEGLTVVARSGKEPQQ